MPRNTRQAATSSNTAAAGPSRRVSFADEQGDAVANTATQKARQKEEEKKRKAEERARARAEKKELQERQAAAKRREKEEQQRRKEEQQRLANIEAELKRVRREKELLEAKREGRRRQEEEAREDNRRARITTDELLDETELLAEPHSPRTLQAMKRDEAIQNRPYKYSVKACLKAQNGARTSHVWTNKIGGLWKKGSFDSHVLNIEIDEAIAKYSVTEIIDIKG